MEQLVQMLQICKFAFFVVLTHGNVIWRTFCRYVPTGTVTLADLRQLQQQIYSERTKDREKECLESWIYRFATHLKVDARQYLEPYVDSSDDEDDAVQSANSIPHLDDIYVNINEPLVSSVQDEGEAEEEFIQEDNVFEYED